MVTRSHNGKLFQSCYQCPQHKENQTHGMLKIPECRCLATDRTMTCLRRGFPAWCPMPILKKETAIKNDYFANREEKAAPQS